LWRRDRWTDAMQHHETDAVCGGNSVRTQNLPKRSQFTLTDVHDEPAGSKSHPHAIRFRENEANLFQRTFTAYPLAQRVILTLRVFAKTKPIYLNGRSQRTDWLEGTNLSNALLAKTKPIHPNGCSQRTRWPKDISLRNAFSRKRSQFTLTSVHNVPPARRDQPRGVFLPTGSCPRSLWIPIPRSRSGTPDPSWHPSSYCSRRNGYSGNASKWYKSC
jgi:hypothetical protein